MTAFRFFLIIVVFGVASVGWMILGGTIEYRTARLTDRLGEDVDTLWGPAGLVQPAPTPDPLASDVQVRFDHEHRYKGLIWFSTYTVDFSGTYEITPWTGAEPSQDPLFPTSRAAVPAAPASVRPTPVSWKEGKRFFIFSLPEGAGVFENLTVTLDDEALNPAAIKQGNRLSVPLPDDSAAHTVAVTYRTYGRDTWLYDLSRGGDETSMIEKFSLTATTDFTEIGYAEDQGGRSPEPQPAEPVDGGMRATWEFENRTSREKIGIEMPSRQNAGAVAGRMAFFAPIGLLFFFTVLFTIVILKQVPLHPMHYLFISAGFFAFHILLAYLVDRITLDYAFWICAIVSVFLVVSYMRLVAGVTFAVVYVGIAQLVYLVGFSYAFTWEGNTGLTITIAAIATLFVLMQATGRLDWGEVFKRPPAPSAPAHATPSPSVPAHHVPPPTTPGPEAEGET
jgi:hypothetical protein